MVFSILKRALGIGSEPSPEEAEQDMPEVHYPGRSEISDKYFALSFEIERGKAAGDYPRAIRAARETYPILPAFVQEQVGGDGAFHIRTSHAVHTAPTLMAVMEQPEGLRELRAVLEAIPELRQWLPEAEQAEADLQLVPRIMAVVAAEPGVLQSRLKTKLGLKSAPRLGLLVGWLERGGRIRRIRTDRTHQLYPAGYAVPRPAQVQTPAAVPKPAPSSAVPAALVRQTRVRRSAAKARPLDFTRLPVIRLPLAPAPRAASEPSAAGNVAGHFQVEGPGWQIADERKLSRAERPDPFYKEVHHTGRFTHWVDPKGHRVGFEDAPSVVRVTDAQGEIVAERGLAHDTYRADVNADGTGILFLSREGMLHGYSQTLDPFLLESLQDLPEFQAQAKRLDIGASQIKSHTRCVAVSTDRRRYLVTVVDEAWCLDAATGQVCWGFRMPTREGWTRSLADRSGRTATAPEVQDALRLMDLTLPVGPADITRQYRALARRWHPDLNPGDPAATRRFQELRSAMEILTGTDLSDVSAPDVERVTYERLVSAEKIEVRGPAGATVGLELQMTLVVGEAQAADWIYAANLGRGGQAFLAGHSGKVVTVSPAGDAERVYDIGAVPRRIVDGGGHLYILTDSRLYVLSGDRLVALVDVEAASDVIVADRGFALLEGKAVTWFEPDGRTVGAVRTKDPLRRVLSLPDGLRVETRQHCAVVKGAPSWWS